MTTQKEARRNFWSMGKLFKRQEKLVSKHFTFCQIWTKNTGKTLAILDTDRLGVGCGDCNSADSSSHLQPKAMPGGLAPHF